MTCLNCREKQHRLNKRQRKIDSLLCRISAMDHLAYKRLEMIRELQEKNDALELAGMTDDERLRWHQRQADEPFGFDPHGGS